MFQQSAEDRLKSWREFRHSLDNLPLEEALERTAQFWARAPFYPYYLDPADPAMWPDPWNLIMENVYCDLAKCLGIVYTVLLTTHRSALEFEMRVYKDPATGYEYNIAWINQGKYILNLIDGQVVNKEQFDKTLQLKKVYSAEDIKLENY